MNKNINLLPPELRAKDLKGNQNLTKFLLIIIAMIVIVGYTLFFGWIKLSEYRAHRLDKQLTQLMPEKVKIETYQKENKQLKAEIADLTEIQKNRIKWTPLLNDLSNHLPQDMWITDFSCNQEKRIQLQGIGPNLAAIGIFLYELHQLPYFEEIKLQQTKEIKVGKEVMVNYVLVGTLAEGRE